MYLLTIPKRIWFTVLLFTLIPVVLTFYIWTASSKEIRKWSITEWEIL